jgi:hypothetical protein
MKRFILVVLLLAFLGSMAYAVVITRAKSTATKNEQNNVQPEKKQEKKKKSGCGSYSI